jgi:DNA-directed RNA polymerase specialized sigma24 family protein
MPIEDTHRHAASLHWLAFLLTGNRESGFEIAVDTLTAQDRTNAYFSDWMVNWSRRVVIAKALAAIREDLAASARRTDAHRVNRQTMPSADWSLHPGTTKAEVERALLAIDVFPRAVLLLLIFEKVPLADATVLLDADADLIRKALAIGLRELTQNLALMQGWIAASCGPGEPARHLQHH